MTKAHISPPAAAVASLSNGQNKKPSHMEELASSGNDVLQQCLSAFMECDSVIYLIGEQGSICGEQREAGGDGGGGVM